MVTPLALVEPNDHKTLFTTDAENATMQESERGTFGGSDTLSTPAPEEPSSDYAPQAPAPTPEPSESTTILPEEPELCDSASNDLTVSNLSSLGVLIVPSFLVALGFFVVFKKWMN
jgi:hypothetical protein